MLDGDRWLNTRISVRSQADPSVEIQSVTSMRDIQAAVFAGTIRPSQLRVVREILPSTPDPADIDTAVFSDLAANYDVTDPGTQDMTVVHARGTLVDGTDRLRNVERLTFSDGTTEVVDIPTNTPATGTVNLSDMTPDENQQLTATPAFADADGVNANTTVFQWQMETGPNVWGTVANGETFTPRDRQAGRRLRVVATFQDGDGVNESVLSATTEPVTNVDDPAPPPLDPAPAGPAAPQAPAPPAPAALTPSTLVGKVLAPLLRARRVRVSSRRSPITVSLDVPAGAKVVRLQVVRRFGRRPRSAGVALRTPFESGRHRYRLNERALRRLKAGRYEVRVRVGRSRADLGPIVKKGFTIGRAAARR